MTDWTTCSDEELLSLRFRNLRLGFSSLSSLSSELLTESLAALDEELRAKGFRFRPHVWLADEWFCPDGVPGFAVPFYLAHGRLRRLERRQMREVEGGTLKSCLRLLRHETGHAIDNAYRLRRRRERKEIFGPSDITYPDTYAPRPYSRRFVRYLEGGYAQSHPDEDFAETFAVWLDPHSRWRKRYTGWPALTKLSYVNDLMREIADEKPLTTNQRRPGELSKLSLTLGEHYRLQRKRFKVRFAERYDADLEEIFRARGEYPAAAFLRRHRGALRRGVARKTGSRCYTVDDVLRHWIARTRTRQLFVKGSETSALADATAMLTVHVERYLLKHQYRIPI